MRVRAAIHPDGREEAVELREGASGMDLLKALDLPPDLYVLSRGEEILTEDEPLRDGDEIRLVRVVSGGGTHV
jgi:sulfur carrier protein ThiS